MTKWEKAELTSCQYLQETYGNAMGITFRHKGGADSTVPDIAVIKNGSLHFYVECKMDNAQSGQFVVFSDPKLQRFVFSGRNHSDLTDVTKKIITSMESSFSYYDNPGKKGKILDVSESLQAQWIMEYYGSKGVRFFIVPTENSYILFPLRMFPRYFSVEGTYRVKKSGSATPSKKIIPELTNTLAETYHIPEAFIIAKKNHLYITDTSKDLDNHSVFLQGTEYRIRSRSNPAYEVRKLSDTHNANVIFSISLKQEQQPEDLKEFEDTLSSL